MKDIGCAPEPRAKLKNSMAAMMYGFSVSSCISAVSEPRGPGLGTLPFDPERLRSMATDARFSSVRVHDVGEPANVYYEIRV